MSDSGPQRSCPCVKFYLSFGQKLPFVSRAPWLWEYEIERGLRAVYHFEKLKLWKKCIRKIWLLHREFNFEKKVNKIFVLGFALFIWSCGYLLLCCRFCKHHKDFGGTAVISNRIKGRLDTSIRGLCFVGTSETVRIFLRYEIKKGLRAV